MHIYNAYIATNYAIDHTDNKQLIKKVILHGLSLS